jgi:hypothetical protein
MKKETIVFLLFLLLVFAALAWRCTTERKTSQTAGMVGYTPYKPTFHVSKHACHAN